MTDKAEDVIDSLHEAEGLLGNECECMNHEDFCSWCSACKAVENARDLLASQAAEIEKLYTTNTRFGDVIASQAAEIERLETLVIDITDLDLIDHDRRKEIAALREQLQKAQSALLREKLQKAAEIAALREQLQKAQSALQMTSDWFAAAQAEAELYLIPNNDCNQYWFVSRMLWHLDGPTQRALKAAIDAAMEETSHD